MGEVRLFCLGVHPEEALLRALKAWNHEVRPQRLGTALAPDDKLLVLVDGAPDRASCRVLKVLVEILADPLHRPGAVAVVSFETRELIESRWDRGKFRGHQETLRNQQAELLKRAE